MSLTFAGTLERAVVVAAADRVAELVDRPEVADAWARVELCGDERGWSDVAPDRPTGHRGAPAPG